MLKRVLSLVLLLSGISLVIFGGFVLWKRNDPSRLQFKGYEFKESFIGPKQVSPVGITFQSLGKHLPIVPASKNNNTWETTPDGVSFLSSSALPGETGNSILYGHNWGSVLGDLYKTQKGDEIFIVFSDKTTKSFKIERVFEVSPDEASVLAPTNDKRITVYTCSGLFDEKRIVVTASLIESS